MSNIYRGNLIIPVRTLSDSPQAALDANRDAAREISKAMAWGDQHCTVYRDTYTEPQASTELAPIVWGAQT